MAAFLTIKGKELEAKCTFGFQALADKKYSKKDQPSDEDNGFETIYMGLIDFDNKALVAFWECATVYLSKSERPSIEDIQEALEARFEEDGDSEKAVKEAFQAIDDSSFFKKKASKFWSNAEMVKEMGDNEEERKKNLMAYNVLQKARNELND